MTTYLVAAPAVPVAVKVSGEPVRPGLVAVSVLAPAVVPSVQLPTVAMPDALVVADAPVTEPPPEATAKVTATPATGLLVGVGDEHARRGGDGRAGGRRLVVAGVHGDRRGAAGEAGRGEGDAASR